MPDNDLSRLWCALDSAAFRRVEGDVFVPLTELPGWAAPLLTPGPGAGSFHLGRTSFFLEHFLAEAEELWAKEEPGTLCSCAWSEPALLAPDEQLQATAVWNDGKAFLVIEAAGKLLAEHRTIMQQARQGQLEREALIKEIEKREVLVHCIVHDLANPLSGIVGALDLVGSEPISDGARRIVRMAQDACSRQQTLIQQILDVFSAEAHALEAVSLNPAQSPDLARTARASLENGSISFQRRGVQSRLVLAPDEEALDWRVIGEVTRLDRVFANLLENALRHSPPGSTVDVRITRSEGDALVEIEDAGTGVPEEAVESLFRKLSKSKSGVRGKAGLGLYFCRITIERWGGAIGYRPGAGGGACFWFRLPLLLVNTSGNAPSAL